MTALRISPWGKSATAPRVPGFPGDPTLEERREGRQSEGMPIMPAVAKPMPLMAHSINDLRSMWISRE